MNFESIQPSGKQSNADETMAREENEQQFEKQADIRNKNRNTIKKILGISHESDVDIAHEEALRVNELVDQVVKREYGTVSSQDVVDGIIQSTEFDTKDDTTLEAIELFRDTNPEILRSIKEGDIDSANFAFTKLAKNIEDLDERKSVRKSFERIVSDQADTFITSKDVDGINNFGESKYDLGEAGKEEFPEGTLFSEEGEPLRLFRGSSFPLPSVKRERYNSDHLGHSTEAPSAGEAFFLLIKEKQPSIILEEKSLISKVQLKEVEILI